MCSPGLYQTIAAAKEKNCDSVMAEDEGDVLT